MAVIIFVSFLVFERKTSFSQINTFNQMLCTELTFKTVNLLYVVNVM
jgi:hypothetical protein